MGHAQYLIEARGSEKEISQLVDDLQPVGEMAQATKDWRGGNGEDFPWIVQPEKLIGLDIQTYGTNIDVATWMGDGDDENLLANILLISKYFPEVLFTLTRIADNARTYCESVQNGYLIHASRYCGHSIYAVPGLHHLLHSKQLPVTELHERAIQLIGGLAFALNQSDDQRIHDALEPHSVQIDRDLLDTINDLILGCVIVAQLGFPLIEQLPAPHSAVLGQLGNMLERALNRYPIGVDCICYLNDHEYRTQAERFLYMVEMQFTAIDGNDKQHKRLRI